MVDETHNELKLTPNLYLELLEYIKEVDPGITPTVGLQIYLSMVHWVDVEKKEVSLRGFSDMMKEFDIPLPPALEEFK